jgi:RNA-directed DNA polymerase
MPVERGLSGFEQWSAAVGWEEPVSEPRLTAKPFVISKEMVCDAYKSVKANRGAPGVDEQSIAEFEVNLKGNLYKLWNRLSSGRYFPAPVRGRDTDDARKGTRLLGVATASNRTAQTVAKMGLGADVEPLFDPDSYGYRPGRSALDAVEVCRRGAGRRRG